MSIQPALTTQPPSSRRNVLIVGGGPAGLAVALMLAKRDWTEITVLEKRVAADYYEPHPAKWQSQNTKVTFN